MLTLAPAFRRWAVIAYAFGSDWIWVLLVVVVLFGGSQLPKLAKNAGDAMKEFRKAHDEATDGGQPAAGQQQAPPPAPPAIAPPAIASVPVVAQPSATVPSASQVVVPQAAPVAGGPTTSGSSADQVTLSRAELDALITVAKERAQGTQQPQA
jgi:sec-independent protein translocase protein TatA